MSSEASAPFSPARPAADGSAASRTPGVVVVSCFDPVRREVARISLERLVQDGRIHPARIEEIVAITSKEMEEELIKLGNLAFSSPSILGPLARRAGVSCETCHVNGAGNAKFFMPKMSTRPGNFDTTGALFNPKADNGVLDPVRIPSLRGARYLAGERK